MLSAIKAMNNKELIELIRELAKKLSEEELKEVMESLGMG